MWAEPTLRAQKSTMPRRRFNAISTVDGAGAGPLNPGLGQIQGRLPEVVGSRIYGELHIGPQDEKMDTEDFSPTTHPVSCEVALGESHGFVSKSTDTGPGRGETVMFETGELGWWFGAPGDTGPDDLSFYRRQIVDEFPVTRVVFGDRFVTSSPRLVADIMNGVRMCYPISSDVFVSKKKPRLTITFGLSDTAQLKVPDYSSDTYTMDVRAQRDRPAAEGDWPDWVIQKRGRVLGGARMYAALIKNDIAGEKVTFNTVLLSDIPFSAYQYPGNMIALVHLGTLKMGYTARDTVIEIALAPTLIGRMSDIPQPLDVDEFAEEKTLEHVRGLLQGKLVAAMAEQMTRRAEAAAAWGSPGEPRLSSTPAARELKKGSAAAAPVDGGVEAEY